MAPTLPTHGEIGTPAPPPPTRRGGVALGHPAKLIPMGAPAPTISTATVQHAARESIPPKHAHPGGRIVTSDKRAALAALLKRRKDPPTADQLRAAKARKLQPSGEHKRVEWVHGTSFIRRYGPRRTAFHLRRSEAQDEAEPRGDDDSDDEAVASLQQLVHQLQEETRVSDPLDGRAKLAPLLDKPLSNHARDGDSPELFLHLGSAKPHAADGGHAEHQRDNAWAPAGSLRRLEPEQNSVLAKEALPVTNVERVTEAEDPPPVIVDPPGPFTTAQLIPPDAIYSVTTHRRAVTLAIARARRGRKGWAAAKRLRPAALILEEEEALNPCGRGYTWSKRDGVDLWDVVQPSSWPDSPPDGSINVAHVIAEAETLGLTDKQLMSWIMHGFPGAAKLPPGRAVLGYPHVGALENIEHFEALGQRDIDNGFVSHGHDFPSIWPTRVDCMNVVMQHGKPRLTIDKRMRLASLQHPDGVDSYNDALDLDAERAQVGTLRLPQVWMFTRAVAILQTAGVEVLIGKFDLATYFRMHGKQRAHVHQSGRLFEASGFGHDHRVNFGERDAMDHTCRASDALCIMVRIELRRLDVEYPSKAASIVAWIAMRLGCASDAGESAGGDRDFTWVVFFFFFYFVDDAGLAVINDRLFDRSGRPRMVSTVQPDGTITLEHDTRASLYFRASMNIVRLCGHDTPLKKQSSMGQLLELLGIDVDLRLQKRLLSREKRRAYREHLVMMRAGAKEVEHGAYHVEYDMYNSILHKLLSACEVIALGRQHLYHARKASRTPNRLRGHRVVYGAKAVAELDWWEAQLLLSHEHGLPLASRWEFPVSSDSTIVHYGDASREVTDPAASGYGAWAVIRGVFIYIEGRWSAHEVASFSINVLETVIKDAATFTFAEYARSVGCTPTHSLAYVDNSTAENIAEYGRTTADSLHALNLSRQERLVREGIHQASARVASTDNDVADLLSRGDVAAALRFPRSAGLEILRLRADAAAMDTSSLPVTWDSPNRRCLHAWETPGVNSPDPCPQCGHYGFKSCRHCGMSRCAACKVPL